MPGGASAAPSRPSRSLMAHGLEGERRGVCTRWEVDDERRAVCEPSTMVTVCREQWMVNTASLDIDSLTRSAAALAPSPSACWSASSQQNRHHTYVHARKLTCTVVSPAACAASTSACGSCASGFQPCLSSSNSQLHVFAALTDPVRTSSSTPPPSRSSTIALRLAAAACGCLARIRAAHRPRGGRGKLARLGCQGLWQHERRRYRADLRWEVV